jgi:hypothetical protein
MDSPFSYGKVAFEDTFTDRDLDRKKLSENIKNHVNTILISPRRWGKSSLMKQLGKEMMQQDKSIRFCHLDLFAVRSEDDFFRMYTNTVLRSLGTKMDELLADISEIASGIAPFLSLTMGADNEFKLGMDIRAVKDFPEEILQLPERLAKKRGLRPVICLDEFQNISSFSDPLAFQKLLRSVWQHHSLTTYCLYGSKRSMMTEMFTRRSKPFYRFGEVHFLKKIVEADWIPFIIERFASTGRTISSESAQRLTRLMECHPYYVQQIGHHLWTITPEHGTVEPEMEQRALELMLNSNAMLYERETEGLRSQQIGLLLAIANHEARLTSAAVIARYRLGSSAYATRMKKTFEDRELIDTLEGKPEFVDPVFRMWLLRRFAE